MANTGTAAPRPDWHKGSLLCNKFHSKKMGKYLIAKTIQALHLKLLGMCTRRIENDLYLLQNIFGPSKLFLKNRNIIFISKVSVLDHPPPNTQLL